MASFEDELKRIERPVRRLTSLALFPKKIEVRGAANFVAEGPNIIIGNHVGSQKDVGLLFRIVPRPIFFTANKMIFDRDDFSFLVRLHLQRHLKGFGPVVHLLLKPFYALVVNFISSHIANVGSIPVDMDGGRAVALRKCEAYLKQGRAIIALQGRGRVDPSDPNPYVKPFRRGASVMAWHLFEKDRIDVPVTPLAIFGTHLPFPIPGTIRVNVGEPMFIRDHLAQDAVGSIEKFRAALQGRVTELLMEIIRRDMASAAIPGIERKNEKSG
jgi:1-acyl-sn-glycerol-3-phosphate acyltransferase